MEVLLISIFVLGYLAITLEHTLKVDKLIPALAMMALLWAIVSLAHLPVFEVDTALKKLVPSSPNLSWKSSGLPHLINILNDYEGNLLREF